MGFYDEDDIFGEVPDETPSYLFTEPPNKLMRLSETWMEREPTTSDGQREFDADDFEKELDSDEVAARHETLRRIGLKKRPISALRRYLEKVVKGGVANPFLSVVHSEKSMRKTLRRFVVALMIKACEDEGIEDSNLEETHHEAIKFIEHLNEELVESLSSLGNFSSDLLQCARNNCQKAFIPHKLAQKLVSRIQGDYTHCQVPECLHAVGTHDDVNYLIVEGGSYSQRLEMPTNNAESPSKLLCLCSFHNGVFEFMFDIIHMKWNIYHNCVVHVKEVLKDKVLKDSDEVLDELPSDVIRSLVHFYMARYFCLWAFGDVELWSKYGCTFFQAVFGMESSVV